MKKISYLLLPLMALPFVASCANAGGGSTSTVTKEEFNKAIKNEGVDYLQTHVTYVKGNDDVEVDILVEISPNACYTIIDGDSGKQYSYAKLTGTDEVTYVTKEESGSWSSEEKTTIQQAKSIKVYFTPDLMSANYMLNLGDLIYEDYEYLSDKKCYFHRYEVTASIVNESHDFDDVYISFENGKVSKATHNSVNENGSLFGTNEITYTYKKNTPKDPRK